MNKLPSVQDVDRCGKCGHRSAPLLATGLCASFVKGARCPCKCEFPSTSVSEAAPERICIDRHTLHKEKGGYYSKVDAIGPEYARVHQPPEQNSDSGEMQTKASSLSSVVVSGDSLLGASDSRFRIVGRAEREGDLFLLIEDAEGQYIFTQRTDDAEQWAVFSECMVGSITTREVAAFVQNAQLTKSAEGGNNNNDAVESSVQHETEIAIAAREIREDLHSVGLFDDAVVDHPAFDNASITNRVAVIISKHFPSPSESESTLVTAPDVQAADAMLRSVSLEMSAWLKVNPNATATHACFELMRRVESTLAASPVQPEVSKEQQRSTQED